MEVYYFTGPDVTSPVTKSLFNLQELGHLGQVSWTLWVCFLYKIKIIHSIQTSGIVESLCNL